MEITLNGLIAIFWIEVILYAVQFAHSYIQDEKGIDPLLAAKIAADAIAIRQYYLFKQALSLCCSGLLIQYSF